MKHLHKLAVGLTFGVLAFSTAAIAELKVGAPAPEFKLPAYLAGQPFTFDLAAALKKGPVVVYFFPAAHTSGCNVEAHLFSEAIDQFKAENATVVGVRWCVLTNGDEYRIYNSHAPVNVEQKLFRSVRISDTANASSAVDTLHLLSKDQMQGRLLDDKCLRPVGATHSRRRS